MPSLTPPVRPLWLTAADFIIAAVGYVAAAYVTAEIDPSVYLLYEGGLGIIALTSLTIAAVIYFQEVDSPARLRSPAGLAGQLTWAFGIAFLLQAVLDYLDRAIGLRLPVMLTGSAFSLAALLVWRLLYYLAAGGLARPERVILAVATPLMREMGARIQAMPRGGMTLIGYLDDHVPAGMLLEGAPVLGPVAQLNEICDAVKPDRVFADFEGDREIPESLIKRIAAPGLAIEKPSVLYEQLFKRVCTARLRSSTVLFTGEFAPAPARMAAQSVYNNLFALAGLAVLAPVMLLIVVLIKITSRGPVNEFEQVMGWKSIPFMLLRFRCTSPRGEDEGGPREVNRLGRWLKRLHLDVLPQLLSILRGELALVGPRPVARETAAGIIDSLPYYKLRFLVKPGLTGWSQLNAPSADPAAELEYDLYYVGHLSLAMDCYILARAVLRLLRMPVSEKAGAEAQRRADTAANSR